MEKSTARGSIFDKRNETMSQETLLRRCDFADQWDDSDTEPPTGVAPPLPIPSSGGCDDRNAPLSLPEPPGKSETVLDPMGNSVSDEHNAATVDFQRAAEDPTVRIVSREQNIAAELGKKAADRTVHDVLKKHKTVSETDEEDGSMGLKKSDDLIDPPSGSENQNDEWLKSTVKNRGRTKLKIPMREVVKAIVMNSKNLRNAEEDREIDEAMSFVQILMRKGIKFPGM